MSNSPSTASLEKEGMDILSAKNSLWLPENRLRNGCYETPVSLCDFMLAMTDRPGAGRLLEPGCGAGIFLARAWERRQQLYYSSNRCGMGLFCGIERDAVIAEVARLRLKFLSERDGATGETFRIDGGDFLAADEQSLGLFDVIIGNPPYVRQEHLCPVESAKNLSVLAYRHAEYLKAWPEQKILFSTKTDLYVRFLLQATLLLAPGGRLTFVISNSWLNAAFGQALRQFIRHHFHLRYLVESACERWFRDAAVNAVILALEKKDFTNIKSAECTPARLIRLLKPLAEWMPDANHPDYWERLDGKINRIETDSGAITRLFTPEWLYETENLHRWAFILRAPATLRDWTDHPALWRRLDSLGRVRYALKTGINRFFYMSRKQAATRGIESEFLVPVARSARQIKNWLLDAEDCDTVLFSCAVSPEVLAAENKTGALAYIAWGETQTAPPRQKRLQGTPWPQVISVRSNRPWYAIQPLPTPDLLCSRFVDQRFFFLRCQGQLVEDQTFYGVTLYDRLETPPDLIAGLLNSTLSCLLLELNARTSLGEGVLQYARGDVAAFPVLNPDLYQPDERQAIMDAFHAMVGRGIASSLEVEFSQPDRIRLDLAVLSPVIRRFYPEADLLALREQWAQQLLERVRERHHMARSASRRRPKMIKPD